MDTKERGGLRQRANTAASHARLITDPAIKAQWQTLGHGYAAQLAEADDAQPKAADALLFVSTD